MKTISLVDECIAKFIKGGMEKFSPRAYPKGAIKEMEESGLFLTSPKINLTEDGIYRAHHLELISELKTQSMLAALEKSGQQLKRSSSSGEGVSNVA